jgi:hypothetical protein
MVAAVAFLAVGVDDVALRPGQAWSERTLPAIESRSGQSNWVNILAIAFGVFFIGAVVALIVTILQGRRPQWRYRYLLVLLVILVLFTRNTRLRPTQRRGEVAVADTVSPAVVQDRLTPKQADVSRGVMVFAFLVALALVLVAVLLIRSRRNTDTGQGDDEIGINAQAAADALRQGGNIGETIQRCYLEMCDVLHREQGIERGRSMTPTEFESLLAVRGFPAGAVHNLTALFEQIRYGGAQADASAQRTAIESLDAIAQASRQQQHTQAETLDPATVSSRAGSPK